MQKTYSLALLCLFQISLLTSSALFAQNEVHHNGHFVIYGEVMGRTPHADSVSILLWDNMLSNSIALASRKQSALLEPGNLFDGSLGKRKFTLAVPVTAGLTYFSLSIDNKTVLQEYFALPGDTVKIGCYMDELNIFFTGKSKVKFKTQHQLRYLIKEQKLESPPLMIGANKSEFLKSESYIQLYRSAEESKNSSTRLIRFLDKGQDIERQVRESIKYGFTDIQLFDFIRNQPDLQGHDRELMELEALGMYWYQELARLKTQYDPVYNDLIHEIFDEFQNLNYSDSAKAQSYHYISLLHLITTLKEIESDQSFVQLIAGLEPLTREMVALRALFNHRKTEKFDDADYQTMRSFFQTAWICEKAASIWEGLKIDSEIAPFPFLDLEGKEVSLRDFPGKVLVLDFWFTGCKPCVDFYKETISKLKEHYKDSDEVLIISINADTTIEKWKRSIARGLYTSADAINLHATQPNHPFLKHYELNGFPYFMIIDQNSNIKFKGFTQNGLNAYISLINANL